MGAYCVRTLIRSHTVQVGEIMVVLWSDYYGAAIFGDGQEIACIPLTTVVGLRSWEQPRHRTAR